MRGKRARDKQPASALVNCDLMRSTSASCTYGASRQRRNFQSLAGAPQAASRQQPCAALWPAASSSRIMHALRASTCTQAQLQARHRCCVCGRRKVLSRNPPSDDLQREGCTIYVRFDVVRGCGEGWASHFSVHARKGSELYIIAFVSGSHVLWF